jgi:CBS domain containing-hemolysin-like protein
MEVLAQLRSNKQSAGIILNSSGRSIGLITLDAVLETIFAPVGATTPQAATPILVDRTFPGSTSLNALLEELPLPITPDDITLSQFIIQKLGHRPEPGETLELAPFTLTVTETSIMGVKTVRIQSTTS